VSGEPYAVETLGPESLVTLRVGDTLLTVRVFSDEPPDVDGVAHVRLDEATCTSSAPTRRADRAR
jgi:hypothetical protein